VSIERTITVKIHPLKTWPRFYQAVADGSKTFEVRKNDRDFQVGDVLELKEWDHATERYTGREMAKVVTYVLHGGAFGIDSDFCVLSLRNRAGPERMRNPHERNASSSDHLPQAW
jgi:hypothetical protein